MNTTEEKTLSTADLAGAANRPASERDARPESQGSDGRLRSASEIANERAGGGRGREAPEAPDAPGAAPAAAARDELAPLFLPQVAEQFRVRWDEVQIGFVDDPTQAVRRADELVAQVMKNLAETFSTERANFEGQVDQSDTEHLRVALRRYRSFFQRLLSL